MASELRQLNICYTIILVHFLSSFFDQTKKNPHSFEPHKKNDMAKTGRAKPC